MKSQVTFVADIVGGTDSRELKRRFDRSLIKTLDMGSDVNEDSVLNKRGGENQIDMA